MSASGTPAARMRGVTLIELMIVVVIVGIIATMAFPAYRRYVIRADRADATTALLQLAAAQERWYLNHNSYTASLPDLGIESVTTGGKYTLAIETADARGFRARADAIAGQVDDDKCPVFAIDHRGFRYGGGGPVGPATNEPDCWRGR